jgi:hypothetical protein
MEDPNAVLLCEWTRTAHRAQRNLLTGTLHLKSVSGLKMQLFA